MKKEVVDENKLVAKQTLMEITEDARALDALLEEFDGDINDDNAVLAHWMHEVQENLATKIDRYAFLMDRMEMRASQLRAMGQEIHRAARSIERHIEGMKNAVKISMGRMDTKRVEGKVFTFSLVKAKATVMIDEAELPEEFKTQVISMEPNKELIDEKVKAGEKIAGVTVIENRAIRRGIRK